MESGFLSAAVCILSVVCIMLGRKIASLNERIDKLEDNIRKEFTAKFTEVKLSKEEPPQIIVEAETAFQRYQRGKLG